MFMLRYHNAPCGVHLEGITARCAPALVDPYQHLDEGE